MVKGHVVAGGQLVKVAVVADDGANVDGQQPAFPAKQQVVEAVPLFADHDDGGHGHMGAVQVRLHLVRLGESFQLLPQGIQVVLRAGKVNAHEKHARIQIAELGNFFHIAAVLQNEARNSVYQPFAVGAGESEDVAVCVHA